MRIAVAATTAVAAMSSLLGGCGMLDDDTVVVNVGYQSKTINTINAGTLMRDLGEFEQALDSIGERTGTSYRVVWQDFSSGAPLTAQMIASHVDIGSMGDYPLLTNGSKTRPYDDARTAFVAATGYSLRGSLNQVVVPSASDAQALEDLRGAQVSTSLGSAGDGMLRTALERAGMSVDDIGIVNQDPSIGAAAIEGGQVDAMAQFVPWPQLTIFRDQARLLYDGGDNEVPTFHGVVAREEFAEEHPEVMEAFTAAMVTTTQRLHDDPLGSAIRISEITGIEPEVVYLYNGPNGLVTFDPALSPEFVDALEAAKGYLVERGSVEEDFDIEGFVDESFVRDAFGDDYDRRRDETTTPNALTGTDEMCGLPVDDPGTASEVWFAGETETVVAATPSCLLSRIASSGSHVRAAYVPDAVTGTKLFADHATWVADPAAPPSSRYLPFATAAGAAEYRAEHATTVTVSYEDALAEAHPTN
nr:ABC transporter substrate-binding protein [Rhodococcus rhodnii]